MWIKKKRKKRECIEIGRNGISYSFAANEQVSKKPQIGSWEISVMIVTWLEFSQGNKVETIRHDRAENILEKVLECLCFW